MSLTMNKKEVLLMVAVPIAIFFLFFSLFSLAYLAGDGRMFADDVFYHTAHSRAYYEGTAFSYPVYTTFASHPVDMYYGYHLVTAGFLSGVDVNDTEAVLWRVRIMNSVLAGIFFSVLYFIAFGLARVTLDASRLRAVVCGIGTVFILSALVNSFDSRLLLIRPHLLSSLFMLLSFYFSLRRRYVLIFLLGVISPLFYSMSVLVFIPPVFFALSDVFVRRFKIKDLAFLYPLASILFGWVVGILFHPDILNYLYNALFVNSLAIISVLVSHVTIEGAESSPHVMQIIDLPWFLGFLVAMLFYLVRYHLTRSFDKTVSSSELFLLMLTVFFFPLLMLIERGVEYFFPFWSLLVVIVIYRIYSYWTDSGGLFLTDSQPPPSGGSFWIEARKIGQVVYENKKRITVVLVSMTMVFFIATWLGIAMYMESKVDPSDQYKRAADFIYADSKGIGIVFTQSFSDFPRLVFFNPHNQYIMGFANMYTYQYSKDLYKLYFSIVKGEEVCQKTCASGDTSRGIYDSLKNDFHASYVFLNTMNGSNSASTSPFFKILEQDSRFERVFVDDVYPSVMVYKL